MTEKKIYVYIYIYIYIYSNDVLKNHDRPWVYSPRSLVPSSWFQTFSGEFVNSLMHGGDDSSGRCIEPV